MFAWDIESLIGRLQDSHSQVRSPDGVVPGRAVGELPFLLTALDGQVVAVADCACGLLMPDFPSLRSINGLPVDSLIALAGVRFRGHSPQRHLSRALEAIGRIHEVLARAGKPADSVLVVTLAGARGDTILSLRTARRRPAPPAQTSVTAEGLGPMAVLRIPRMFSVDDPRQEIGVQFVRAALESRTFRESRAVIIDVRGNRGGTRDILELVVPFFVGSPLVYNIADLRGDTTGARERGLLDPDERTLDPAARGALRAAIDSFRPRTSGVALPDRRHLRGAVILPSAATMSLAGKLTVVLMDEGSYSATDVFLGAMRHAPNVTLMGTPSAGGSGRARTYVLPHSRVAVTVSTMASYQPDGTPFDGVGIVPDIVVPRTMQALVSGHDNQFAEAVRHLYARLTR
jgi:C-terminal processing protease CtpA/Prc